jgi:adenylate cyclase
MEAAAAAQFPRLRAGVTPGMAVTRAGLVWQPSQRRLPVTNVASPGGVLVAESARAAIGDMPGIEWSFARSQHLRGIRDEVRLFASAARR